MASFAHLVIRFCDFGYKMAAMKTKRGSSKAKTKIADDVSDEDTEAGDDTKPLIALSSDDDPSPWGQPDTCIIPNMM